MANSSKKPKSPRASLQPSILVVEDNDAERLSLIRILEAQGFVTLSARNASEAMSQIDERIDVVLSDLRMGQVDGIDLLQQWKKQRPDAQFILLTGHGSINSAVDAMKAGAFDYVVKPINPDELVILINRATCLLRQQEQIENLSERLDERYGLGQFIGQSEQMRQVFQKIKRVATVDSTVLILGESGTGKELVAQALHQNSHRKKGPFIGVNCAAVPATLVESELFGHVRGAFTGAMDHRIGRFEQADGGTLLIDEIGDFDLGLQAKLLRVLETLCFTPVGGAEERKVNVRILTATNRNLQKMVHAGTFREDLFYRLNVVSIELPPLRERTDDIPLLVDHFLEEICEQKHTKPKRMSPEAMKIFQSYRWPGNIRQLRNVLESLMVLTDGEILTESDVPEHLKVQTPHQAETKPKVLV